MKICVLMLSLLFASAALACDKPLETVKSVDIQRYMGKWYEIAAFPQSFQKGCNATTAEYSLKDNGKVKVVNSCRINSLDGKLKVATGVAKVVDIRTNSKLKVSFFWPFYGDYWILDLGENYEYVMVGAPDRNYLWFLSRTPTLDDATLEHLRQKAHELGFDISRLKTTLQSL